MHILCVGISHRTAPVELRERLAMSDDQAAALLEELRTRWAEAEAVVLSTCNRTELYVARPLHGHPRVEELSKLLSERSGVGAAELAPVLYHADNEKAVAHLMRVAGGLDSMVLGEPQILGQVRGAYERAQGCGTVGRTMHKLMQAALAAGKRVRSETKIAQGRMSVSSVAASFARHLFRRFDDKTLLVIGAGKMTELALEQFIGLGPARVRVANRTIERAKGLAEQYRGTPHGLYELPELLSEADLVISSTGAAEPIVTAAMFRGLLKRRRFRPIFVIDIAVPRDFEPGIGELPNVYLYDMDDLQRAVADSHAARNGEVGRCEELVAEAVAEVYAAIQFADFTELIQRLREQMHELGAAENQRTLNRLRDADPANAGRLLEEHTQRLINKILHRPMSELGRGGAAEAAMYATALRRLFDLGGTEDLSPPEANEAAVRGEKLE